MTGAQAKKTALWLQTKVINIIFPPMVTICFTFHVNLFVLSASSSSRKEFLYNSLPDFSLWVELSLHYPSIGVVVPGCMNNFLVSCPIKTFCTGNVVPVLEFKPKLQSTTGNGKQIVNKLWWLFPPQIILPIECCMYNIRVLNDSISPGSYKNSPQMTWNCLVIITRFLFHILVGRDKIPIKTSHVE